MMQEGDMKYLFNTTPLSNGQYIQEIEYNNQLKTNYVKQ